MYPLPSPCPETTNQKVPIPTIFIGFCGCPFLLSQPYLLIQHFQRTRHHPPPQVTNNCDILHKSINALQFTYGTPETFTRNKYEQKYIPNKYTQTKCQHFLYTYTRTIIYPTCVEMMQYGTYTHTHIRHTHTHDLHTERMILQRTSSHPHHSRTKDSCRAAVVVNYTRKT